MVDTTGLGSVNEVRLTLADETEDTFEDAVIERALTYARVIVGERASEDASRKMLEEAVIAKAACRVMRTEGDQGTTRKEAADLVIERDGDVSSGGICEDADDLLDQVTGSTQPGLWTVGGRTRRYR